MNGCSTFLPATTVWQIAVHNTVPHLKKDQKCFDGMQLHFMVMFRGKWKPYEQVLFGVLAGSCSVQLFESFYLLIVKPPTNY